MKKLLAIVISMAMIVAMMPVGVFADDNEAKIGTTEYATLEEAIEAAEDGATVELLKDVALEKALEIKNNVTLNLGTFNITSAESFSNDDDHMIYITGDYTRGCTLTLTGTTGSIIADRAESLGCVYIQYNDCGFRMLGGNLVNKKSYAVESATLIPILKEDRTLEKWEAIKNASIIIEKGTITSQDGNGSIGAYGETNLEITGGTIKNDPSSRVCLYISDDSKAVIEGKDTLIESKNSYSIEVRQRATLEIRDNARVVSNDRNIFAHENATVKLNQADISGTGFFGYIDAQDNAKIKVIGKTKITSTQKSAFYLTDNSILEISDAELISYPERQGLIYSSSSDTAIITVTGGTFTSDPTAYISKVGCYSVVENSAESITWTVVANHTWNEGKITTEPTYDTTGIKTYTCTIENCGATKTEVVPKKERPYVPSTPSTPADNVTNNTTDKNTTADLTPAVSDNKSTTTVDNTTADKIVDKAVANKSTEVIVDATGNNTVASSEVAIPEKTVKELAEKTDANLVIKTDNGKVDLDKTALEAVAEQAGTTGTVTLVVETVKTDENICHVDLKLVTSNGAVKDFRGGNVKVTINLTKELAAKELVCVYIDDNGIYTLVEGVLNADGTYTFTTGHFSEYAVMAKEEADKTMAEQLDTLIKEVNLKVRTSKTSKKNIKAVVSGDVKALTDAGYTVKYKFYRSIKKASKYAVLKTKADNTYINTKGKKGTKYYYKAKALVYQGDKLVGQTELKQCKYGVRTWSK